MYGLVQIYTGCKCGETWRVNAVEEIDIERDEIYQILYCEVCGSNNLTEKKENGIPCMHILTSEEHESIMLQRNDDEDF